MGSKLILLGAGVSKGNKYIKVLRSLGANGIWLLDEPSGNALDVSGNNRHLTLNGAPTRQQAGPVSGILPYSASNFASANYFSSSDAGLLLTGAMTVGLWLYTTTPSASMAPIDRDASSVRVWSITTSASKFRASEHAPGTGDILGINTIVASKWYHIVMVYQPSTAIRLYQDGTLDAQDTSGVPAALAVQSTPFFLGKRNITASEIPWVGRIAGAFYIPRALSAAEVRAIYHAGTNHKRLIIFDGDSLTVGFNVTPAWPDTLVANLSGYSTYYNLAIAGQTVAQMNTNSPAKIDHLYDSTVPSVVCFWGGVNDVVTNNDDATTLYNRIVTYCQARKAAGFKVVVSTLLPASSAAANTNGWNTKRATINANIRANWQTFADAIADIAANTTIGEDGDSDNTTYYNADKVHMTAAGYAIVSGIVDAAVRTVAA